MNRKVRLMGYLFILLVLTSLLVANPGVWATPEQNRPGQTVPTKTSEPPTAEPPTAEPPEEQSHEQPAATQPPPATATPASAATVTPSAVPPSAAALVLVKLGTPRQVWPGSTVNYTLTLTNKGTGSARQVELVDTLPAGLDPGTVLSETAATWTDRTLRAQASILPPGGQLVVAFNAIVRTDVQPGTVLINQASASAAGGLRATARATTTLPPAELPPTGGDLGCGFWTTALEH